MTTDECNCLSSPNMLYAPCKACREKQWKPKPGERVLVEAVVTEVSEEDGDCWLDMPRDQFGRFLLTELRPLPVQGEGVGK